MEHFYQNIGEDWFTYPDIYTSAVNKFPNGNFMEIGSWKGRSIAYLAVEIINSKKDIKLYCVDTWKGSEEHLSGGLITEDTNLYQEFLNNVAPVKDVINPIKSTSLDAAKLFEDEFFDFIFIDASHKYEDVKNDLNAWYPKLKKGGFFAGHDYPSWEEVKKAVDEWVTENNYKLEISGQSLTWGLTKRN